MRTLTTAMRYNGRHVPGALAALLVACTLLPHQVRADAALYLSPPSAVIPIGETFTLDVLIDTGGEVVNAIEGSLTFAQEEVALVDIDTDDSVVASWVERPRFDSTTGRLTFSGATGAQGYAGTDGRVLSVSLEALRPSASQVWFSQGAAVFSANGQASNVLSGLRSGTYTLTEREITTEVTSVATPARSSENVLRSSTHPDPEGWAATSTGYLFWELPEGIGAVRFAVNADPEHVPQQVFEPAIDERIVRELPEGVTYAHLQLREAGTWGPVFRYPLRTDTTPPEELSIDEDEREDLTDPRVAFSFTGVDVGSGISYYEVAVNGGRAVRWEPGDEQAPFLPEDIGPGEHTLLVRAVDGAGNDIERETTFVIEALPTPELAQMTDVNVGEPLTVRGSTLPSSAVEVEYSVDDGAWETTVVRSDSTGEFAASITELARAGDYEIRVRVQDDDGAQSQFTDPMVVTVAQPTLLLFGTLGVSYLTVFLALVGAVSLLLFALWLLWYGLRRMRGLVAVETREAEELVHSSFREIQDLLTEHLERLQAARQARTLTPEEEKLMVDLSSRLQSSERHLIEEIEDIQEVADHAPVRLAARR
ncbi:hypothetical protein GVX82_04780 [Patescibacteria group bacterium]|nr:hypothetical protein [Patescibacteria group bacterium]